MKTVKTWVKGLIKQVSRTRVPPRCLEIVLLALRRPPYDPVKDADLKHLNLREVFLVAITSARRASELHALLDDMDLSGGHLQLFLNPEFRPKVASDWHIAGYCPASHRG